VKRKLLAILLVAAVAISMGLVTVVPIAAAGTQVVWDIGMDNDSRSEFNHTDFNEVDTFTYVIGTNTAADFPAFLYVDGYNGSWEEAGVHEVKIEFDLTKAYYDVTLEYQKFGGETDEVRLDVTVDGVTVPGPGENTAGTYYLDFGDLPAGSHYIVIECVGVGTGEGAHTYDYFALTTPTWDVTVNAEASGSPLAVPITGVYDSTSADGTTSYTIDDVPDSNTVTLTAPLIHVEGSNVYAFRYWYVEGPGAFGWSATSFTVNADTVAAAYYQELENFVTGGGKINMSTLGLSGKKVALTFGWTVGVLEGVGIVGQFQIVDHIGGRAEAWHCNNDFSYLFFWGSAAESPVASHDTATFTGTFTSNRGSPPLEVTITIQDLGEPGAGVDTISDVFPFPIHLTIDGGNFQVHDIE